MVGENGQPETPEWQVTPHDPPEFLAGLSDQDRRLPEHIELGEN